MAKKFFYVCAGLFLLIASYHLGARLASAQSTGNAVVGVSYQDGNARMVAITQDGDTYLSEDNGMTWHARGNCFSGGPVTSIKTSWGAVKTQSR